MTEAVRRGLYIFIAALAVIIGDVVYEQFFLGGDAGGPAVGGAFSLIDQDGATRTDADLKGKVTVIYFGYTYCPDACPTTLQAISQTLDLLGDKASKVQPVFISVDPARDTPAQLKTYAANFHPGIVYLTGSEPAIKQTELLYQVYAAKVPQQGTDDYLMDHSSVLYVMGRDGRYMGQIRAGLPPKVMAATLQQYL